MFPTSTLDKIVHEVATLKKEIKEIKHYCVPIDSVLTEEDFAQISSFHEEKKSGKLIRHDALKKELSICPL
ncbi:MAG: hypothetical protein WCP97_09120 [bacterium]